MEDCGRTYRLAEDHLKKLLNQAIFSKLWIEKDGRVTAEFAKPFDVLVTPLTDVLIHHKQEKARGTNVLTDIFSVISNRFKKFFGNGWSNDLLVGGEGIEPSLSCENQILSLARLPIPPLAHY